MEFFYWNKSFELGIEAIDHQHRRLVDMLNGLASAISDGARLSQVRDLFGALLDYAAAHFADEEQLLDRCALPAAAKEEHKNTHREFVAWVRQVALRRDLPGTELGERVLEFLTTWLISHILGSDRQIAAMLHPVEQDPAGEDSPLKVSPVARVLLGALRETERRFRLISDNTPALIWVADTAGTRGFMNRAWADFTGDDLAQACEKWAGRFHPDDLPDYLRLMQSLRQEPRPAEAEYRLRDRRGDYRWFLEKILPRITGEGAFMGLIASATDVTSLKEAEALTSRANEELEREVARRTAQLEQLMLTDPLTGIGNRRYLMDRLDEEIGRAHRYRRALSAVFLDLDHFKRINDTCGHAVGDHVLVQTAATLKSCLRDCDLLARFGGEEFVALLPDTPLDQAFAAAERWRADIAALKIAGVSWTVTTSAGVAQLSAGEGGESLLRRCDEALYLAKSEGRNCIRPSMFSALSPLGEARLAVP